MRGQALRIKRQIRGIESYLQHIGKSYHRVRHYVGFRVGKPVLTYHRQELECGRAILGQGNNSELEYIDHSGVDQNLYASGSFNQKGRWAGSLVRTGRKPPKLVVVGSNPTPPATKTPRPFLRSQWAGFMCVLRVCM